MPYTASGMDGIYFGKKTNDFSFTVKCAHFSSVKTDFTWFQAKNQPLRTKNLRQIRNHGSRRRFTLAKSNLDCQLTKNNVFSSRWLFFLFYLFECYNLILPILFQYSSFQKFVFFGISTVFHTFEKERISTIYAFLFRFSRRKYDHLVEKNICQ